MADEYTLDIDNLKVQIKYLAARQGLTIQGLKEKSTKNSEKLTAYVIWEIN